MTKNRAYIIGTYIVCLGLFIYLINRNWMTIKTFNRSNGIVFFMILLLTFVNVCIRGAINSIGFNFAANHISLLMGIKLALINTIGNYLPMSAGLIAKGMYLKKKYDIDYVTYTTISIYLFVCSIMVGGLLSGILLLIIPKGHFILYTASILMGLSGIILLIPTDYVNIFRRIIKTPLTNTAHLHLKKILVKLILLYVFFFIISGMRLFLSYSAIGHYIEFIPALLLTSIGMITRLISITPANIGFYESVIAGLGYSIDMNFQLTIVAVAVDRIAEIVIVFGMLLIMQFLKKIT